MKRALIVVTCLGLLAACGDSSDAGNNTAGNNDAGNNLDNDDAGHNLDNDTGSDAGNNNLGEPITHSNETIDSATTWSGLHIVEGGLEINAKLTLEPCTRVEFAGGNLAHVRNGGAIEAIGEADCPVIFTSALDSPGAGDWQRFDIWDSASNDNRFEHVVLEYGGADQYGVMWVEGGASVAFSNVVISDTTQHGADFETGAEIGEFDNITFENIGGYAARMGIGAAATASQISASEVTDSSLWVRSSTVSSPLSLSPIDIPYELNNLEINDVLTVEAGTHVQMAPSTLVHVRNDGSIRAEGTSDAPVIFESAKRTPAAGDWERFDIWSSASNDSTFTHTTIRHGGEGGTYGAMWVEDGAQVTLDMVTFEDNEACDVYLETGSTVNDTDSPYSQCN